MASFISYKNSTIAYHVYGNGKYTYFCFHGFSLSGLEYDGIGKMNIQKATLIALDFPVHGATLWNESSLDVEDWYAIFELIYQKEKNATLEKYGLMGHSMGGRICLSLFQNNSAQIEKLILFAPDGLSIPIWYKLIFNFSLFRAIFRLLSKSNNAIIHLGKLFYKLKWINKSSFNLINSSLGSKELADLLYHRIILTKNFYPNIKTIKSYIVQNKVNIYLFFGYYDSIIPQSQANLIIDKSTKPYIHLEILQSGHMILDNENNFPYIKEVI